MPETRAALANILLIGGPAVNNAAPAPAVGRQPGMRLRGAVNVSIHNTAVRDFDTGCIRIDDAAVGGGAVVASAITLVNVLGECAAGYYNTARTANTSVNSGASSVTVDAAYALTNAAASVAAPGIPAINNGSGFVFDNTDYVGAVKPGTAAADTWWADWIIEGSLD